MSPPTYFQLTEANSTAPNTHSIATSPSRRPELRFLLKINDLSSKGSKLFLSAIDIPEALQHAVTSCLDALYPAPSTSWPGTRSITLVLKSMPGVAYTTGSDLDDDHKEIHFSTDYVESVSRARLHNEILGVITHEVVHTLQHNGRGTAPSGLIEGVADFVRLKAGYVPPHWKKEVRDGVRWDRGYEHTAFFLEFLENKQPGSIVAINETLRDSRYDKAKFWPGLFKKSVDALFEEYTKSLEDASEIIAPS